MTKTKTIKPLIFSGLYNMHLIDGYLTEIIQMPLNRPREAIAGEISQLEKEIVSMLSEVL